MDDDDDSDGTFLRGLAWQGYSRYIYPSISVRLRAIADRLEAQGQVKRPVEAAKFLRQLSCLVQILSGQERQALHALADELDPPPQPHVHEWEWPRFEQWNVHAATCSCGASLDHREVMARLNAQEREGKEK